MTAETQAVKLARLQAEVAALTRSHEQERRVLEGIAPVTVQVAEHEVRINDVKTDVAELKVMVGKLAESCAKNVDLQDLKEAVKALGGGRQQVSLARLSVFSAIAVALIGAAALIIVAIVNSGGL